MRRPASASPEPSRPAGSDCLIVIMLIVATALWFAYEVPAHRQHRPDARQAAAAASRSCGWRAPSRSASAASFRRWNTLGLSTLLWTCYGLGFVLQFVDSSVAALRPAAAPGAARQVRAHGRGRRSPPAATASRADDDRPAGQQRPPGRPDMTRLTRADLDALPTYVPGRSLADLARELGIAEAIKLASNEVPYGPLPGVVGGGHRGGRRRRTATPTWAWSRCATRSPSGTASTADRIATGCGSVALRRAPGAGHLPARRRDRLLVALVRGVPDHRGRPPARPASACRTPPATATTWRAMAAAITDRTRLIFVCNPNNPTGTAVRRAELDRVPRRRARRRAGGARRGVPGVRHRPGRARRPGDLRRPAERGGAAHAVQGVGPGRPADRLPGRPARGGRRGPQGASPRSRPALVAQAAALAALDAGGRGDAAAARWWSPSASGSPRRCASSCRTCPTSQANFVWLPLGERAAAFGAACEERGVIVRPFAGDGVRVTIGTPEENDAFLAAAETAL